MEGSRYRFAPIFPCLIALSLLSLPLHAAPTVIRNLIVPSLTAKEASNGQRRWCCAIKSRAFASACALRSPSKPIRFCPLPPAITLNGCPLTVPSSSFRPPRDSVLTTAKGCVISFSATISLRGSSTGRAAGC